MCYTKVVYFLRTFQNNFYIEFSSIRSEIRISYRQLIPSHYLLLILRTLLANDKNWHTFLKQYSNDSITVAISNPHSFHHSHHNLLLDLNKNFWYTMERFNKIQTTICLSNTKNNVYSNDTTKLSFQRFKIYETSLAKSRHYLSTLSLVC